MEVAGSAPRRESNRVRSGHYERQAAFVAWITDLFTRASLQGIALESLTDFELEWIGRM